MDSIAQPSKTKMNEENCKYIKKPIIALKSNLLFDVASVLNIEAEIPIKQHWSVNVEYQIAWWINKRNNSFALQVVSGGLEGRYWFADKKNRQALAGHFIGIYGNGGIYDLQLMKDKGHQGKFYLGGVSYGYVVPISSNFSIEFSLGIGYFDTNYRFYKPDKYRNLIWQYEGMYNWFGPNKAKVSIVWLLNHKVKSKLNK